MIAACQNQHKWQIYTTLPVKWEVPTVSVSTQLKGIQTDYNSSLAITSSSSSKNHIFSHTLGKYFFVATNTPPANRKITKAAGAPPKVGQVKVKVQTVKKSTPCKFLVFWLYHRVVNLLEEKIEVALLGVEKYFWYFGGFSFLVGWVAWIKCNWI